MRFDQVGDLLQPGYLAVESGAVDLNDGFRTVCALTPMPRARAKMVEWWFGWLGGTEHCKPWRPVDYLLSDWQGRTGNSRIGSSHLVHENPGGSDGPDYKLRINFRDPAGFFDPVTYAAFDGVAICARIGLLETPVNLGLMAHFMRNTVQGCEMRSRRFLGHIASRDDAHPIPPEAASALRQEIWRSRRC